MLHAYCLGRVPPAIPHVLPAHWWYDVDNTSCDSQMQPHENKDIIIHVCQRKQTLSVCYIEVPLPRTTSSFIQVSMHTKLVPHRPSSPWALPHGS